MTHIAHTNAQSTGRRFRRPSATHIMALLAGTALLGGCGGGGGGGGATTSKGPLSVNVSPALAGTPVTVQLSLPAGVTGPADISYSITAGNSAMAGWAQSGNSCAEAGADFLASPDTPLSIPDGSNNTSFVVPTCANTAFEPNEKFNVTIGFEGGVNTYLATIVNTAAGGLNDTGISQCLNAAGAMVACSATDLAGVQDGQGGRDASPLTNAGTDGRLGFAFAPVGSACQQDKVTGLVWDLRADSASTLAAAQALVVAANAEARCGRSDWRLPNVDELLSLVDAGAGSGARIDASFTSTPAQPAWTATPYAADTRASWVVDFGSGVAAFETVTNPLAKSLASRLVAGTAPTPAACIDDAVTRWTNNTDGTVTDKQTGLMWMQCTDGQSGSACASGSPTAYTSFAAALQRAKTVSADAAGAGKGHDDWRVPNRNELASLVSWNCTAPAIHRTRFPNTPSNSAWTSSPAGAGLVWYVDFTDGNLALSGSTGSRVLRLVRAGQ